MTLLARFLILVTIALLPSVAMHAYDLLQVRRAELAKARDDAERLVIAVDGTATRVIEAGREVLLALAESDDIRHQRTARCDAMLARLHTVLPPAEDIMVTDPAGTVVCSTDPDMPGTNIGGQPHVATATATGKFAIGQFSDRETGEDRPSLGIALPYRLATEEFGGILAMILSLAWLEDELAKQALPARSVVTLADQKGVILARLPKDNSLIGTPLPPSQFELMRLRQAGIFDFDGVIVGHSPLSAGLTDLFVGVTVPKDHLGEQLLGRLSRGIALGITTLATALALAALLYRRLLVPPVLKLVAAGDLWARGDYGARADVCSRVPELETLAHSFNAMAEKRQLAEEALERINAQLEALLVNAPVGFCFVDRDLRYVRLNDRLAAMNGVPASEHLGRRIADVLPQLAPAMIPAITGVFATGRSVEGMTVAGETPAQPGTTRHWLCGFFPVTDAGSVALAGTVVMEITDQKRAEQALRTAKQEAERANMAKSKFLASASHDLRQPVQSLMLFTSTLAHTLKDDSAAAIIGHMDRATMALKAMLDGILDISRLDAGTVAPDVRDVPLGPMLDHMAEEYRPQAGHKGIRLIVLPTRRTARSDPALLERILRNLIDNAIKYTAEGKVLVGCRRHGEAIRIMVGDTGIGIPDTEHEAIFDEFYQVGNPERDRSKGLGLGLAIVQRLARLLGHPIGLSSTPGKGTAFRIDVPAGTASVAAIAAPAPPHCAPLPSAPSGLLVAVVEDEENVRAGLRAQLEAWGHRVVAGADHTEILALLGGDRPDVILADFRLRGTLTGIEALERLRAALGWRPPGILLTGDTAPERMLEARRSGYPLLHKPITAATLAAALRELAPGA
ncbi:MAG: ATP-binding protein [Magnetospirillum sp.]|nr:ATP-binding protein [Magnetospirillum sp.]